MQFARAHAIHFAPLVGLGAWFAWTRLARGRARRARAARAPRGAAPPLALLVAACSVGAAAVHGAVIGEHFREATLYGWFFVLCAQAQLAWGVLVARRADRVLLLCGMVANALVVGLWLLTRTTGLPVGPEPWKAEGVGRLDVLATVLEVVLVAGSVALLANRNAFRGEMDYSLRTLRLPTNLRCQAASPQDSAKSGTEFGLPPMRWRRPPHARPTASRPHGHEHGEGETPPVTSLRLLEYLPQGNTLDDQAWRRRHAFLQWLLLAHLPGLFALGLVLHHSARATALVLVAPLACLLLGRLVHHRRTASFFITAGLVYCSAALVGLSRGSIEAHFHFFIMVGFIALYQDWVPFLWNIVFTVLSHGIGSLWQRNLIFDHPAGQARPWVWSGIHGLSVLAACVGVVVFWKTTEDEQQKTLELTGQLADAEINRRQFTSDMLVNLARRNQSLLYRQLEIINQLEEQERDPDALGGLFRVDHLATRIRRNAESLLVLSGEAPPRTWSGPVLLVDVVRAAIAETEDLDRVGFFLDERLAVLGRTVTDLTHLLAELVENAARFSPPEASVIIRVRSYPRLPGAHMLTVEDWGIGMPQDDLAAANDLLAHPREVDLSAAQRLGLHVVARLALRHDIDVSLTPTPGSGVTAIVVLPPGLFAAEPPEAAIPAVARHGAVDQPTVARPHPAPAWATAAASGPGNGEPAWGGWWEPRIEGEAGPASPVHAADEAPEPFAAPPGAGRAAPLASADRPAPPASEPQLKRRVPQSHLAPELRREPRTAPGPAAPGGARVQAALSRYQASRQAAQAQVEGDGADGSERSSNGGGWS